MFPEDNDFFLHGGYRLGLYCHGPFNNENLFVGYSPRNQSPYQEGTWADWINLAEEIIRIDKIVAGKTGDIENVR